jgi:hypothetical protein
LCRYITRPAIAEKRLSLSKQGLVRYELKTPYRDGTTHVIFEPVDFIAKLAALVPRPRVNLTRFHGVFAPNSLHRVWVTPAKRGKGSRKVAEGQPEKTPTQPHVAMSWAQRLKRVFNIDVETCRVCGGAAKVAVPAHPAHTAFVRPCTSLLVSRTPRSSEIGRAHV